LGGPAILLVLGCYLVVVPAPGTWTIYWYMMEPNPRGFSYKAVVGSDGNLVRFEGAGPIDLHYKGPWYGYGHIMSKKGPNGGQQISIKVKTEDEPCDPHDGPKRCAVAVFKGEFDSEEGSQSFGTYVGILEGYDANGKWVATWASAKVSP